VSKRNLDKELKRAQQKVREIKKDIRLSKPEKPKRKRHIYVLKCQGGKYYVGQTVNINRRLSEHKKGTGSWFTAKYKPLGVIDNFAVGYMTEAQAMHYENETTARYMQIYSIDDVRGGDFITRDKKYWEHKIGEYGKIPNLPT